jgi:tape measure domain-containing protein
VASEDLVAIRVRMTGTAAAVRDERAVRSGMQEIGSSAAKAGKQAQRMGSELEGAFRRAHRSVRNLASGLPGQIGSAGILGGALYGAGGFIKMGLQFNAQVQSARERFRLFTDDVDGLQRAVSRIDLSSQFNFGDLAQQAALLGNFGVQAQHIPRLLQGIANAAAASGQGTQGLERISLDLGQIQSQGKVTGDELRDLAQAGAPVANILKTRFHLTAKEMTNVGAQSIDARKFLAAVADEWNSGRMAHAAQRQLRTLGGQWDLFTGNVQKLSGAATQGLAAGLAHDVLPAANRTVSAITALFGRKGLSNEEKLRQARDIIRQDLGPTWEGIKGDIDRANIPQHLGEVVAAALPYMAANAASIAPQTAKAFVNAFLHSGPWGMLITTLFIGNKIRGLVGGARGGRGGGLGGLLGGAASRATPIPVWVVNNGPMPGRGPGRLGTAARRIAPFAATAGRLAIDAGPVALALGIPVAAALEEGGRVGGKPTQPRGRTAGQVVQGHDTYLGPMRRSMATPTGPLPAVVVSDRQTQQALANLNAHQRARR